MPHRAMKLALKIWLLVRVNILEPEFATQLEIVHKYAFISLFGYVLVTWERPHKWHSFIRPEYFIGTIVFGQKDIRRWIFNCCNASLEI